MSELTKELEKLNGDETCLIISPAGHVQDSINTVVEFLVKKENIPGAYISLNKPYKRVKYVLLERGVNTNKIFFIDCITASVIEPTPEKNVLFVSGPSDLIAIATGVSKFIEGVPSGKFLIIDALGTLLVYNRLDAIARFTDSLTSMARRGNMKIIFVTTGGEDQRLIKKVIPFFDRVIKVE